MSRLCFSTALGVWFLFFFFFLLALSTCFLSPCFWSLMSLALFSKVRRWTLWRFVILFFDLRRDLWTSRFACWLVDSVCGRWLILRNRLRRGLGLLKWALDLAMQFFVALSCTSCGRSWHSLLHLLARLVLSCFKELYGGLDVFENSLFVFFVLFVKIKHVAPHLIFLKSLLISEDHKSVLSPSQSHIDTLVIWNKLAWRRPYCRDQY